MIFLGTTFFGDRNTLFPPVIEKKNLTSIQFFDGTYNHLLLSTDTSITTNNLEDDWNQDTKIDAKFDGTFDAGNSVFSLNNTDCIVIKRRESGTMNWTVIYTKEVEKVGDLHINIVDKYARSGVEYEYAISSYVNGIENSTIINNVYSRFDGYYVTDKDCLYGTIYNVDGCDTTRNTTAQLVELLNSQYMTVVSNSVINCDSGSVSGVFFKIDEDTGLPHQENSLSYRNSLKDRLANKKPLILKVDDGRIWMISVTGSINDNMEGAHDLRNISFEWTEIGDINDMKTLYLNGFSDVDSRWW